MTRAAAWWERIGGIPPHLIPLVEVVRTAFTRQDVVDRTVELLRDAGKVPVVVHRDVTGFIGNRLNQAMWREALALIEAGVWTPRPSIPWSRAVSVCACRCSGRWRMPT